MYLWGNKWRHTGSTNRVTGNTRKYYNRGDIRTDNTNKIIIVIIIIIIKYVTGIRGRLKHYNSHPSSVTGGTLSSKPHVTQAKQESNRVTNVNSKRHMQQTGA